MVDLSRETEETRWLCGMDQAHTEVFGRNCVLARRLVERGERFVQLYSCTGGKCDSHTHIEAEHSVLCAAIDTPQI